jgi:hypothetical protein
MEAFETLVKSAKRSNSAFLIASVCLIVVFVNNNVYLRTLEKREKIAQALIEKNTSKQEELLLLETEIKKREVELAINMEKWRAEWAKRKAMRE